MIGTEDTWLNLSLPTKMPNYEELLTQTQQHSSFDVVLDCDLNDDSREAGTPAPPQSPEVSRYNGFVSLTPWSSHQQLGTSLKGTAKEEVLANEMDVQSTPVHF
jgi:hypothetical protein